MPDPNTLDDLLRGLVDGLAGLSARVASLERHESPNQGLDATSSVTFGSIYPGTQGNSHLVVVDISALAAGANIQVDTGASGTIALAFIINASDGTFAIYTLQGGVHATQEISDPSAKFTNAKGGAGATNVYWEAAGATYRLENNLAAGAKNYRVLLFMNG